MTDFNIEKAMPTFREFKSNPEKWLGRDDDVFVELDRGSSLLSRYIQRHQYEIYGYRCKNLEEVERIAGNLGYSLKQLTYIPELKPHSGYKCDLLVRIMAKADKEKRDAWR